MVDNCGKRQWHICIASIVLTTIVSFLFCLIADGGPEVQDITLSMMTRYCLGIVLCFVGPAMISYLYTWIIYEKNKDVLVRTLRINLICQMQYIIFITFSRITDLHNCGYNPLGPFLLIMSMSIAIIIRLVAFYKNNQIKKPHILKRLITIALIVLMNYANLLYLANIMVKLCTLPGFRS